MKKQINVWPIGIVGVFGLFIAGLVGVVVIASTHSDSLVSVNYYEDELKFQNQIDAATRAQAAGAFILQNRAEAKLLIQLPVSQANGRIAGTVQFYRPSAAELDHALRLAPAADGRQVVNTAALASGPWLVRVTWVVAGDSYFLEQKIIL